MITKTINTKDLAKATSVYNVNTSNAHKKHIVIVEDDSTLTMALELMLNSYKLAIFGSAEEAVNYIRENVREIDLILLDNMLPGMSGLELLAIVKNDPHLKAVPIIMQSADPSIFTEHVIEIADEILHKPYTKNELLKLIEKVFC